MNNSPSSGGSTGVPVLAPLVGDGLPAPCIDGRDRPYLSLDAAASTAALAEVAAAVQDFLPWYSSVHRGAGYKSQLATAAYEAAREAAMAFAGKAGATEHVAILCRNTTEAINHLAYRLALAPSDTVVTTVAEHHANLLPWGRACRRRYVEVAPDGTFAPEAVLATLDDGSRPALLAITAASNVTGWMPDLAAIIDGAHARGIPVFVDAAQLAAHAPIPADADFVAWSGHKMYAPFGGSALVGRRDAFEEGDPWLAGGGAVDLVDLDEVAWSPPPEREEAGSPNVLGAVALHAAIDRLGAIGWDAIAGHDAALAHRLRQGLRAIPGVRVLGPDLATDTLPLATFTIEGIPHALVAARLSAEAGIGVRHGCFCAHPYLTRLLGLDEEEIDRYRRAVLAGDRRAVPGAVRASAGINTSGADIDRLLVAVAGLAAGDPPPVPYVQDPVTGDFTPEGHVPPGGHAHQAACAQG